MKGLAIYHSQGRDMNSKMYPGYLKSKEKSIKEVEEQETEHEKVVDIENFSKIEIVNRNGRVIGIFDITRFDGVAKFS